MDDSLSLQTETFFLRAQLATAWSTGDTCTACGHPSMSHYFTMYFYKIVGVAVLAFTYHSGYHCYSYYLTDYKLGVHIYCLWPPHYYRLGVHWTTLVCVLVVAIPTSTISLYYFSMCTVCGHSHGYYQCVLL